METTDQNQDVRFYQWVCEGVDKLTPQQRKMLEIAWINDRLYVHAAITGMPAALIMIYTMFDGTPHCIDGNDLFVPVDWIEKYYPNLREAMKKCREKSEQVRYSKH